MALPRVARMPAGRAPGRLVRWARLGPRARLGLRAVALVVRVEPEAVVLVARVLVREVRLGRVVAAAARSLRTAARR